MTELSPLTMTLTSFAAHSFAPSLPRTTSNHPHHSETVCDVVGSVRTSRTKGEKEQLWLVFSPCYQRLYFMYSIISKQVCVYALVNRVFALISIHARPQGYIWAWLRKNCRRTCGLCTSRTRKRLRNRKLQLADQYTPKKVFVATIDSKWNTDHVPLFEDLRKSSFAATMHLDSILHFGFLTSSHRTQDISEADAIFVPMVNMEWIVCIYMGAKCKFQIVLHSNLLRCVLGIYNKKSDDMNAIVLQSFLSFH